MISRVHILICVRHRSRATSRCRSNRAPSTGSARSHPDSTRANTSADSGARVQIVMFMQANDMHLPALAVCHGVSYYPDTKRLAAFTSDRFFRSLAAGNRCPVSEDDSGMCVPASEAAATEALFRIIEGEAASSHTLPQMVELVAMTKFYMADAVVAALPQYLGLAMQQMTAQEVCFSRSLHDAHCASCTLLLACKRGDCTRVI